MRFVTRPHVRARFEGKRVAVVGSGPGVLGNRPGMIDGYDVVVRVNNYKLSPAAGVRTDVFYSFFGGSIKKSAEELKRDGVTLCLCKCPDAHAIESEWHVVNNKMEGVDWRPLYRRRREWWFCDTYIPTVDDFMEGFNLLGRHIPTTGFAAILEVLRSQPRETYITGFDFFRSGIHNVNERWRGAGKNGDDPIRHVPEAEAAWLKANMRNYPITCDATLSRLMAA